VRLQVLTASSMKITAFWDVAPCSLVRVDRRFGGAYCLHHEGDECPDRPDDGESFIYRVPKLNTSLNKS
jgi:hypothetical protein